MFFETEEEKEEKFACSQSLLKLKVYIHEQKHSLDIILCHYFPKVLCDMIQNYLMDIYVYDNRDNIILYDDKLTLISNQLCNAYFTKFQFNDNLFSKYIFKNGMKLKHPEIYEYMLYKMFHAFCIFYKIEDCIKNR